MEYNLHQRTHIQPSMKPSLHAFLLLTLLFSACGRGYKMDDGNWSYIYWNEGLARNVRVVANADSKSFVALPNPEYAKDNNHVYLAGRPIKGADPKTFSYVSDDYAKDAEKVFWKGREILQADPDTFFIIDGKNLWSKDSKDMYHADVAIGVKDLETFAILNDAWAKDEVAYYFIKELFQKTIVQCDHESMVLLNGFYAKDKIGAFRGTSRIKGSDPETFRALNDAYAIDKFNAYHGSAIIKGADLETFKPGRYYYEAEDKNNTYQYGIPNPIEKDSEE